MKKSRPGASAPPNPEIIDEPLERRLELETEGTASIGRGELRPADLPASERHLGQSSPALARLVPELYDSESGRLDANKASSLFELSLPALVRAADLDLSTVENDPDAPDLQPALEIFARIAAPLRYLTGTLEGVRIWMRAPNPDLGGATPLSLLQDGRGAIVAELLEDTLLGQPA